jgi:hypothetical protein
MSPALAKASERLNNVWSGSQITFEEMKAYRAGRTDWVHPERVAAWVEFTRAELAEIGVLVGLSPEQEQRLAALVIELMKTADVDRRKLWKWPPPSIKQEIKHGPGHYRKLMRKIEKARKALNDVRQYVAAEHFPLELELRSMTEISFDETLTAAITVLDPAAVKVIAERHMARVARIPGATGQKVTLAEATDRLTAFFVKECGFGKYQADRRVALIGNTLWDWHVAIDDEWTPGSDGAPEPGARGSSAIRKRRTRRLHRDTPKKSR